MERIVLSPSMAASVNTCTTQAMVRTLGLGLGAEETKQQKAGKSFHRAHELWMMGQDPDACLAEFHRDYDSYSDRNLTADDAYAKSNLASLLGVYLRRNPLHAQTWETIEAEQQIEVAAERSMEGEDYELLLTDIHDGIVRDKISKLLWSRELKTTSSWDLAQYVRDYFLKGQIMSHIWTARQHGFPVVGVQLAVIRINKLPDLGRVTKAGTPYKCRTHGCACEDCWQAHVEFGVWDIQPGEAMIERWLEDSKDTGIKYLGQIYNYIRLDDGVINQHADLTNLPREGVLNGSCGRCDLQEFCRVPDMAKLTRRERDARIHASGLELVV